MKKAFAWIAVLAVVLGVIGYSVFLQISRHSIGRPASQGVPVVLDRAESGTITRTASYSGTLQPEAVVTLTPKTAGRIEEILVKEGDTVKSGQVLVRMEDDVVRLQASQASSAFQAAQAQYEKAKKGVRSEELQNAQALLDQAEKDFSTAEENYKRSQRLYEEGTIPKARFEDADRQYRSAQTQVENAKRSVQMMEQGATSEELAMAEANMKASRAQYDLAELQLDFTQIKSPSSGRVAKVFIDRGNMAGQATPLLTIVSDERMIVKISVPEAHYGEFRDGVGLIPAAVKLSAMSGTAGFSGRVSAVAPIIEAASRTFVVEVEVPNADGRLRAGMYADVDFTLQSASDAMLVPLAAVVVRGGKPGVFVVTEAEPPTAVFRPVETGVSDSDKVQIVTGITREEWIVVEGNAFLEDDQAVSPRRAQ